MTPWNPDAYLAAFLTFHNALPKALSSDLPAPLYDAVAFSLANPVPLATIEYIAALGDMYKLKHTTYNVSLNAIDKITPEVQAFFNDWMKLPTYEAPTMCFEHIEITPPEPIKLIGEITPMMEFLA